MNEQAIADSINVATGFSPDNATVGRMEDLIGQMVYIAKEIPPWWSRARDIALRSFWKDGQQGSAMMYLAQNKLAGIPFRIEARDKSVAAHVRQAAQIERRIIDNSQFGGGLINAFLSFTEDYLGQDNGAFMEILGDGPANGPISGPVMGMRHLDSGRCTRTGNPIYPVVYLGDDSKYYKMHMGRVLFFSQMPSPLQSMYGVGVSSVSRSLRILENLHATINYKDEKLGARDASQILVGSGITGKEIIKTIAASYAMMDSLGLKNLSKTVALGSTGGDLKLERIALNDFTPFDEEKTYTWAAYALAIAWGLEFQELMPVLGNKASETISLQRARGKLPQAYRMAFENQADTKLVPQHLKVVLDYQDDMADQQRATIEDITSRNFERQMSSGVTTPDVVQEIMHDRGYISKEQLREMKLSRGVLLDQTPVQALFFDSHYDDVLLIPRELLMSSAIEDTQMAIKIIEANEIALYSFIGSTGSSPTKLHGREALAALHWLKEKYEKKENKNRAIEIQSPNNNQQQEDNQSQEDNQQPEDNQSTEEQNTSGPNDGRLRNQDVSTAPGVGKSTNFFIANKLMMEEIKQRNSSNNSSMIVGQLKIK